MMIEEGDIVFIRSNNIFLKLIGITNGISHVCMIYNNNNKFGLKYKEI